ncbi:SLC13 family permease [Roseomonas marmotae]|uniref:SLC13 family permease n=1 Tax=Roseomonas marmotae TaxID=2768161 RepID=A0ABS3K8H5_9PROT|nr:SLC13 family permease [Roseomonas marmotae]MBO1073763.1 SLC13 family permease [Roseomonas marmotae]QTI78605.1 SLC13 family permease [Roseomonas marmotae]
MPSPDQAIVFAILAAMVVLFIWNRFRYDLVALLGLLVALACGVVPADKAFIGFSDQIVVIIASALVLSAAVGKSSLTGRMVRRVEPRLRSTSARVGALATAVTLLSTLMKNIGALAILLPVAIQVGRRSGTPASALLMPMAFGSLAGGLVTMIGTSPNIIVARIRGEITGEPFGMFDFTPVGVGIVVATLVYLPIAWRLLPRGRRDQASAPEVFEVAPYLSEAVLPAESPMANKTVAELEALGEGDVAVTAITREGGRRYIPAGHWTLFPDDLLTLRSEPRALKDFIAEAGLQLSGATKPPVKDLSTADVTLMEVVVMPESLLVGQSPQRLRLREAHGVNLLAISRRGEPVAARLSRVRFRAGDVLALQGDAGQMPETLRELGCLPLMDRSVGLGAPRKDILPFVLLALAMGAVAFNLLPVTVAFFAAAVLAVLLRILTLQEAYQAIDVPILVLLACLIPISDAVNTTGGAELIAGWLAKVAVTLPPTGAMALVLLAAMLLTPFLNNAATALIMAPIAASMASQLGLRPDPFLMAVAIGCASDFLTPIGHQCNTLVLGPGGYRFGDYWRLGLPLSLLIVVISTLLIPVFWPLR